MTTIIEKLPLGWKDFKNYIKHKRKKNDYYKWRSLLFDITYKKTTGGLIGIFLRVLQTPTHGAWEKFEAQEE